MNEAVWSYHSLRQLTSLAADSCFARPRRRRLHNGFYVEFIGDLADFNLDPLTANSSLKQPASTITITVTETQAGESGVSTQIFDCSLDDAPTEGKFILSESTNGDTAAIDCNASATSVESTIDALVGYGVTGSAGGPWTFESDEQEAYSWSGTEEPSNPLRKGLVIEVATDQDGNNDWVGDGEVSLPDSAPAGSETISSTGAAGRVASALAGSGALTVFASGDVTSHASLTSYTSRGFRYYQQFSSVDRVLVM